MIRTLDKENNRYTHTPTVYMTDDGEFCEGIDLNQTYQVNYEFANSKHKRTVFKGSGWRLLEGYHQTLMNLFNDPEIDEKTMENFKIDIPKFTFVLYGTYLLKRSDFNRHFNNYKQTFGPELGRMIKNGIKKGKGENFEIVQHIICMYIWKHLKCEEREPNQNIINIVDLPQRKEEDFDDEWERKHWKTQPLTQRLELKKFEDFKSLILNEFGSLWKKYESSNPVREVS